MNKMGLGVLDNNTKQNTNPPKRGLSSIDTPMKIGEEPKIYSGRIGLLGIGESQYDSFDDPVGIYDNLQKVRAERQPWIHEAANGLAGGIVGGLLTAGENISLILDIPTNIEATKGYFQGEETLNTVESNIFADTFRNAKETLFNEYLPIYKEDPSKLIDFTDTAFYWEAIRGVLDSAIGFGVTGLGAGAAVKGLGTGLRATRLGAYNNILTRAVGGLGSQLESGTLGRLSTAYITNYGEGKMMALELYERATEENLKRYISEYQNKKGELPSEEQLKEFEFDAKVAAGKEANTFMLRNKLFIATDYLQLNRMFGATGIGPATRNLVKKPSVKEFLKSQLANAPKEAFEEIGQNVIQMEGIYQTRNKLADKGYVSGDKQLDSMSFTERAIEFAGSDQALLEGAMGMFGGPVQYAITQAPFENRKSQEERYTEQQRQIELNKIHLDQLEQFNSNKDYTNNLLYKEIVGETLKEDADLENIPGVREAIVNLSFENIANRNFRTGTTKVLEEQIQNSDIDSTLKQDRLTKLKELENEYLRNSNKSTAGLLMQTQSKERYLETIYSAVRGKNLEAQTTLDKMVQRYNESLGQLNTLEDYLDKTSGNYSKIIAELPEVQQVKEYTQGLKDLSNELYENRLAYNQFNDASNRVTFEKFQNVMTSNTLTEDKIKSIDDLIKEGEGNYFKNYLKRQRDGLKDSLNHSKNNEAIERNGGEEKIKQETKVKEKSSLDFFSEPDPDEVAAIQDNKNTQEDDIVDRAIKDIQEVDGAYITQAVAEGMSMSEAIISRSLEKLQEGELTQDEVNAIVSRFEEPDISQLDEDAFEERNISLGLQSKVNVNPSQKEPEVVNNYLGEGVIDTVINNSQPAINENVDIKLVFGGPVSEKFKKWLASSVNKSGVNVEYIITGGSSPVDYDIKVIIDGDQDNYTYLFKPRGDQSQPAYKAELALRKQIENKIKKGEKALGKITYQYSGAFITDRQPKSLLEIPQFNSVEELEFMYVNREGYLLDADTKERNTDFAATKVLTNGNPWAGALFLPVTAPNGKRLPLKVNTRHLQANELDLLTSLLANIITVKPEKGQSNITLAPLKDYPRLYNKLNQEDQEFLKQTYGENFTFEQTLNHLIYAGIQTNDNPDTQLYYSRGTIHFGQNTLTSNELSKDASKLQDLYTFLEKFKPRSVRIDDLNELKGYKELIVNNQILYTDVAIENDSIFSAQQPEDKKGSDRYKSMAVYVEPNLIEESLEKPKISTNLQKNTTSKVSEINTKIKETSQLVQPVKSEVKQEKTDLSSIADKINDKISKIKGRIDTKKNCD